MNFEDRILTSVADGVAVTIEAAQRITGTSYHHAARRLRGLWRDQTLNRHKAGGRLWYSGKQRTLI